MGRFTSMASIYLCSWIVGVRLAPTTYGIQPPPSSAHGRGGRPAARPARKAGGRLMDPKRADPLDIDLSGFGPAPPAKPKVETRCRRPTISSAARRPGSPRWCGGAGRGGTSSSTSRRRRRPSQYRTPPVRLNLFRLRGDAGRQVRLILSFFVKSQFWHRSVSSSNSLANRIGVIRVMTISLPHSGQVDSNFTSGGNSWPTT